MILLDTHAWVWWIHDDPRLPAGMRARIEVESERGLAVSAISCWEVAKLVERGRLALPLDLDSWIDAALDESGIELLALSRQIAIASTRLPGSFHRDPADQIIVATSRVLDLPLATADEQIRSYPHVRLASEMRIHDRE